MAATRLPRVDFSARQGGNVGVVAYPNRLQADFRTSKYQGSGRLTSRQTKRERSQNWGQVEKCALVHLVHKRLAVIEDKAGDTDAVRQRVLAWREIHAEFSAKMGGDQRSIQRMREQWRRIKHWAKQEMKYFRETGELDGNSGLKQPNELANYICDMMKNFDRDEFRNEDDIQLRGDIQDVEPPDSRLLLLVPRAETTDYQEQSNKDISNGSEDVIPVALEVNPVKLEQESVDLLDDDDEADGATMVTAPSVKPNFGTSPSNQLMQHPGTLGIERTAAASRKPSLPSWTKDFPEIVGAEPARGANIDDEDDDDESDFLDDSDDDEFSDWGRDNPVNGSRTYDRPPSAAPRQGPALNNGTAAKLDKQCLSFARREFKRRMQMMEAEHSRKMQILELHRETAQLKKRLAFRQLKQRRAPPPSASNNMYDRHAHAQR